MIRKNLLNRINITLTALFGKLKGFQKISLKYKVIFGGILLLFTFLITFFLLKAPKPEFKNNNASKISQALSSKEKIAYLDAQTPLDLIYNNEVEEIILQYTTQRKTELEILITRSELYFPIIESYLDKYDLPLELKYIAVVESGLNPIAKSKSGAVGLWQFLYNTCDLLNLKVNSYIDERRNVFKSTDAACKYLNYLYRTFNDWDLVLAAYNGGPGEVRMAIERSGNKTDYWEIRPFLSEQAWNYVPTFIAFNYLFNIDTVAKTESLENNFTYKNIDTLEIYKSLYFSALEKYLKIKPEELQFLNPEYKTNFIPADTEKQILVLPKDKISAFLKNENKIYSYKPKKDTYIEISKNAGNTEGRVYQIHEVKEGEYFHKLAIMYNCTIENIKAWNNLDSNDLYPGQKLIIWSN